jgi:RNA polymerase sigma-70 factor (ECF subfamily)
VPSGDAEARIAAQEAQLIVQIADGAIEEPMRELCRRYERNLYRFGVHVLGDGGLAEEMVQEIFQRLWRSAGRYDAQRDRAAVFLLEIARSVAAEIRENRPSRARLSAEDVQLPPLPDSIDQILDSLRVREALSKLSSPHADVLRLALEEGLTQSEIAQRLEVPLDTVKTRTFHGMQALRSALGERGGNAG